LADNLAKIIINPVFNINILFPPQSQSSRKRNLAVLADNLAGINDILAVPAINLAEKGDNLAETKVSLKSGHTKMIIGHNYNYY
jgi:hypothetical protein